MKIPVIALSSILLCACAYPHPVSSNDASSQSESSSLSETEPIEVERDDTLRYWWLTLSSNNGKLIVDEEMAFWFYSSCFYEEGTQKGEISLPSQGTFEFEWMDHDLIFGDFVGFESVHSTFSLTRLASAAINSFTYYDGKAILTNPYSEFPKIWFSMIGEVRDIATLKNFEIRPGYSEFFISYSFYEQDENQPSISARISSIGKVYEEVIKNTLDYPPTIPNRTEFDENIQSFITEKTGDAHAIPFPAGATFAFSDKMENKQVQIKSFGTNLLPNYRENLLGNGFTLGKDGLYTKTFRMENKTNQAVVFLHNQNEVEIIEFALGMMVQDSESLFLLNQPLSALFLPTFPESVFITHVYLVEIEPDVVHCVLVFSEEANAREYISEIYHPALTKANYSLESEGDGAFYREYSYFQQRLSITPGGRGNEYGYPVTFLFFR